MIEITTTVVAALAALGLWATIRWVRKERALNDALDLATTASAYAYVRQAAPADHPAAVALKEMAIAQATRGRHTR